MQLDQDLLYLLCRHISIFGEGGTGYNMVGKLQQ